MNQSNFDSLLQRYLAGQVSDEEKARLDAWLDLDKTGHNATEEFTRQEEDRLLRKIMTATAEPAKIRPINPPAPAKKTQWWAAAACILLLAAAAAIWQWPGTITEKVEVMAHSEQQKIILPDGSLVWLQPGSSLQYQLLASQHIRQVIMQGEALFEVAKDVSHPFVVRCGEIKLRVLGTSFHVKAATSRLELKVLTGRVNLSSVKTALNLDVLPNEKVVYDSAGGIQKQPLPPVEIAQVTAGTQYAMQFKHSTLAHVAHELGAKFNKGIIVEDEAAGDCHLTIDLTDMSLESSLQLIGEVLNVTYSETNDTITLSGGGCR